MLRSAAAIALLTAAPAAADAPRVATDILPVHSLVAMVMDGVGEPDLLVPPGASPHGHALRPSEARALSEADLVFWIGHGLTPWLEDPIETLAPDAQHIELNAVDGTVLIPIRDSGAFAGGHDHGDDHDEHGHGEEHAEDEDHDDDHGEEHAEDDDHDHGEEHAKGDGHDHDDDHDDKDEHAEGDDHDHGEEHAEGDGHDHDDHAHGGDGSDPHTWLDPANARTWLTAISAALSDADPDHADTYAANAAAAAARIGAAESAALATLAPFGGGRYVVYHDAYQYFEDHFGVGVVGTIALYDADTPGPARLRELQERVGTEPVNCLFSEPQYDPGLVEVLADGTELPIAVLDPLGTDLPMGSSLYPALLEDLADSIASCAG
ncbi:MAG: zinc ABC transporter substrate-binding protein [Pseudomonadota bacterium]